MMDKQKLITELKNCPVIICFKESFSIYQASLIRSIISLLIEKESGCYIEIGKKKDLPNTSYLLLYVSKDYIKQEDIITLDIFSVKYESLRKFIMDIYDNDQVMVINTSYVKYHQDIIRYLNDVTTNNPAIEIL